ncbi:MAG TPA: hypothetical protein VMJ10_32280 [Kofleriaceae bacterium]|nr:hypothetical protein [Kofleriaceae bacterium]
MYFAIVMPMRKLTDKPLAPAKEPETETSLLAQIRDLLEHQQGAHP